MTAKRGLLYAGAPRAAARRVAEGPALPTVEAAKARLAKRKGLWSSLSADQKAAFLDYDGPEICGTAPYLK